MTNYDAEKATALKHVATGEKDGWIGLRVNKTSKMLFSKLLNLFVWPSFCPRIDEKHGLELLKTVEVAALSDREETSAKCIKLHALPI